MRAGELKEAIRLVDAARNIFSEDDRVINYRQKLLTMMFDQH